MATTTTFVPAGTSAVVYVPPGGFCNAAAGALGTILLEANLGSQVVPNYVQVAPASANAVGVNANSYSRPFTTNTGAGLWVRVTATTAQGVVFVSDCAQGNTQLVDQIYNPNATVGTPNATTETTLHSVKLAPGFLPPNFQLNIETLWQATNNANVKTINCYFGGTLIFTGLATSASSTIQQIRVSGRGDGLSFIGWGPGTTGGWGGSTTALATGAFDWLHNETEIRITATKATGTDSFTNESVLMALY